METAYLPVSNVNETEPLTGIPLGDEIVYESPQQLIEPTEESAQTL